MKIIVGLGNPGKKFKNTRHNAGFLALDQLKTQILSTKSEIRNKSQLPKFKFSKHFNAKILNLKSCNLDLILAKPQTFMNQSGKAVKKVIDYFKNKNPHYSLLFTDYLYVVHDDLDIPLGEYRLQFGRGPAGHHGVASIIKELGTKNFWRLRIGIENRKKDQRSRLSAEDYVLQPFSSQEKEIIKKIVAQAGQKLLKLINA